MFINIYSIKNILNNLSTNIMGKYIKDVFFDYYMPKPKFNPYTSEDSFKLLTLIFDGCAYSEKLSQKTNKSSVAVIQHLQKLICHNILDEPKKNSQNNFKNKSLYSVDMRLLAEKMFEISSKHPKFKTTVKQKELIINELSQEFMSEFVSIKLGVHKNELPSKPKTLRQLFLRYCTACIVVAELENAKTIHKRSSSDIFRNFVQAYLLEDAKIFDDDTHFNLLITFSNFLHSALPRPEEK